MTLSRTLPLCALAGLGAALASGAILFQEDFAKCDDLPPGINPACGAKTSNEPIWSGRMQINVKPEADADVFLTPLALPADGAFDFFFGQTFLNPAKEEAPSFDVVLVGADGSRQTLGLMTNAVAGLAAAQNAAPRVSRRFAFTSDGREVAVHQLVDRVFVPLGKVALAARPAALTIRARAGKSFSLDHLLLRTPAPLPEYPALRHFAALSSLDRPLDGAKVAAPGETVSLDLATGRAAIRLVLGEGAVSTNAVAMTFHSNKTEDGFAPQIVQRLGKPVVVPNPSFKLSIGDSTYKMPAPACGYARGENAVMTNAVVNIAGIGTFHVKPHLRPFCSNSSIVDAGVEILRDRDVLPPASRHALDLAFERVGEGDLRLYVDGSFIQKLSFTTSVDRVAFAFRGGERYRVGAPAKDVDYARFAPLDLSALPRARAFATASSSLPAGFRDFGGVPIAVATPADSADAALCRMGMSVWALEVEEYLGRLPSDGYPASIHFRLPPAHYVRAHLLVALDTDPAKDRFLTLRLSRYIRNGVGNNMVADAALDLAGVSGVPDGWKKVGDVRRGGETVPLYRVAVDLPAGEILDFATRGDYIDFEVLGRCDQKREQLDKSCKPLDDSVSAFSLFGVTLEKAPVTIDFVQQTPGNVFTVDEAGRGVGVALAAVRDNAKGAVRLRGVRQDGLEVLSERIPFDFAKAGETNVTQVSFTKAPVGFYTLDVVLDDASGAEIMRHEARFAVLPKAGRMTSKKDSPYCTWWFNGHSSSGRTADAGGPVMQRAGIRKASSYLPTPEQCEAYDIAFCGDFSGLPPKREFDPATGHFKPHQVPDPADPKKKVEVDGEEWFVQFVKAKIKACGGVADTINLWHESAPNYGIPEELLGLPVPEVTDAQREYAAYLNECGRLIRKHFPELKIQVGNSGASIGAAVVPLRAGANPDYYDCLGMEIGSQSMVPERLLDCAFQGCVITKEVAALLAGREIPLNGCFEFCYRCERDMGETRQAEWYVRDLLISLANNFFLISPGILFDCSSGYYNTLWGGSGILQRMPYGYPKRAYVAYGVLTSVLDGVAFSRQLPTGSTTAYALEFRRGDGKYAYAVWTARGEADFAVDAGAPGMVTTMFGIESPLASGRSTLHGGTSPFYVVTDKPLASVSIVSRSFPDDEAVAQHPDTALLPALAEVSEARLDPDPEVASHSNEFLPILRPGPFTLATVDDPEKGKCWEVALAPSTNGPVSKYVTEYTTLRLDKPVAISGDPAVLGVWVKGNSNWGRVRFEIEDADGEVFRNQSTSSGWGCDVLDWPGNLAIGFDGWSFVYTTLHRATDAFVAVSPGGLDEQWVSCGGDRVMRPPFKLRAITVEMNRTKLNLLGFEPTDPPAIRIR